MDARESRMTRKRKLTEQHIRIPDYIDLELRKLQGSLIRDLLIDVSYSTVGESGAYGRAARRGQAEQRRLAPVEGVSCS